MRNYSIRATDPGKCSGDKRMLRLEIPGKRKSFNSSTHECISSFSCFCFYVDTELRWFWSQMDLKHIHINTHQGVDVRVEEKAGWFEENVTNVAMQIWLVIHEWIIVVWCQVGFYDTKSVRHWNRSVKENAWNTIHQIGPVWHFTLNLLQMWAYMLVLGTNSPVWTPSAKNTLKKLHHFRVCMEYQLWRPYRNQPKEEGGRWKPGLHNSVLLICCL